MNKLKIGVCCTFGAGSSLMLKMNLDGVLNKMGILAEITVFDISGIKGEQLDAIYTSSALAPQVTMELMGSEVIVVPVVNYFDLASLENLTNKYLVSIIEKK
jgi:ascorbate PTS system EIIB component